jgi:hypothetical protein
MYLKLEDTPRMTAVEACERYRDNYILIRMDDTISPMGTVLFVGDNRKELLGVSRTLKNRNLCGVLDGINLQANLSRIIYDKDTNETRRHRADTELQRTLALAAAKPYCESHLLSFDTLQQQQFQVIYGEAMFFQPTDIAPDGLRNDLKTQGKPTLTIKAVDGEIIIEETKFTKQFLSGAT